MKNKLKVFMATLVFGVLITSVVYATGNILPGKVEPSINNGGFSKWAGDILGSIQFIGWGIAVGMLIYVGIKYMMSAANERANLKSGTINWIIGALVIGAASTIFTMVVDIFTESAQ